MRLNINRNRGALMDKIKEIGIKPLAVAMAVLALLAGVLGIAKIGVRNSCSGSSCAGYAFVWRRRLWLFGEVRQV